MSIENSWNGANSILPSILVYPTPYRATAGTHSPDRYVKSGSPKPTVKANLTSKGDVDPKSVEIWISGFGVVSAVYDPKTKLVTYAFTQKLVPKMYTVILT